MGREITETTIVPVEMTDEMMKAVRRAIKADGAALYRGEEESIRLFYAAALRAAPEANDV